MRSIAGIVALAAGVLIMAPPQADARPVQATQDQRPLQRPGESHSSLDIRADDGEVLIGANQIRSYDWETHTLTLAPTVRDELAARLLRSREMVSGIPFVVTVGGADIYKGRFTSKVSSRSFATPVVLLDSVSLDPTLSRNQIRVQFGYPTPEFAGKVKDPRSDERIREALKADGKLTVAEFTPSEWLGAALTEMAAVMPGMTRDTLLKVFREERGLSTPTHRRYAFRGSPYIKVDVTFEPAADSGDRLTESTGDRIIEISRPYLEVPFRITN